MISLISHIDFVARAGGGGSGGGSDGGGIIILLGYLPTHFIGAVMRRKLNNKLGLAITIILTIVYGMLWWFLGSVGAIISIAAFVGGPSGFYGWFGKVSMRLKQKAASDLKAAAATDPAWDINALNLRVQSIFMTFQRDWSVFDLNTMSTYITPRYFEHLKLMMVAIKLRKRRNAVEDPKLIEFFPLEVDDLAGNNQDKVTFLIHAKANDKLLDETTGVEQLLYEDKSEFYEYWHFTFVNNVWILDGISQMTQRSNILQKPMMDFALSNNMYFSPDWGCLLLPKRGVLFSEGKFGRADINNHVIGLYHGLLVELYNYTNTKNINDASVNYKNYVVAQTALPKSYESIIVEAKLPFFQRSFLKKAPRGYNRISLEWPDFNKRYNVYATNVEQVTAFELLNPVFMEKLFALPFKLSIEVVDNVVYLYTRDSKADYATMYNVLKDAFQEMKL